MRQQGKLSSWKDDQGYGFVVPNGGGEKAFVHIKAFSSKVRRPVDGDLITYELEKDSKNRLSAVRIRYAGEEDAVRSDSRIPIGFLCIVGLSAFLAVAVAMKWLPSQIIVFYLVVSGVTFVAYALDKSAAKSNAWRTKESTLHMFSAFGGWPGALIAQRALRHKSKKEEFQSVFWATVIVNCIALGWLITKSGQVFLASFLN